jgi:AP endonuclease-2
MYDEIVLACGSKLALRDAMYMNSGRREPPRLAAKFWDEFSGKQMLLSTFFGKRGGATPSSEILPTSSQPTITATPALQEKVLISSSSSDDELMKVGPTSSWSSSSASVSGSSRTAQTKVPKRKLLDATASTESKKRRAKQTNLSAFFAKPLKSRKTETSNNSFTKEDILQNVAPDETCILESDALCQQDSDYLFALQLTNSQEERIFPSTQRDQPSSLISTAQGNAAWSHLMAPIQPPKCVIHKEPAKEFTVNKPGPNKGKTFFVCSR